MDIDIDYGTQFNSYSQDTTIPIYIILNYKHFTMKFPINPDNLTKEIASSSKSVFVEGIGEVSVPQTPELSKITINSFFWHQNNLVPAELYVHWLERWQKSKEVGHLIVTRFNYSMNVTCERFKHWINAGEERDVYFELELKEYRPYGAKKLKIEEKTGISKVASSIIDKARKLDETVNAFILFDIPRPSRTQIKKEEIVNPYTAKKGETLLSITKKITGTTDDWLSLYDENKVVLGDSIMEENEIKTGTKLIIPNKWNDISSYNIISTPTEA